MGGGVFSDNGSPASIAYHDGGSKELKMYATWANYSSTPRTDPQVYLHETLRKLYPKASMIAVGYGLSVLSFPEAVALPLPDVPAITKTSFVPVARRSGTGLLSADVQFGAFSVAWEEFDFIVYVAEWTDGMRVLREEIIVHDGAKENIEAFLLAAGTYANTPHDSILVFNNGYWQEDHALWEDVQKANWEDVILKDDFKESFRKDIEGFFDAEEVYKKYAIPWKRGIIMYGPPGNGKTISLKAVMKSSTQPSLYVRSFQTYGGEQLGMQLVFDKARLLAPCILVLEDLDTLINNANRSFFLNQLDGLQGNDGLLLLSTTNYLEKLDPSLSQRPSRFDRKFEFPDPDLEDRKLYVRYWQNKLRNNTNISFPDSLIDRIAVASERFSFAYLKEAFVSSLVLLADDHTTKSFKETIMEQIEILKKGFGRRPTVYPSTP